MAGGAEFGAFAPRVYVVECLGRSGAAFGETLSARSLFSTTALCKNGSEKVSLSERRLFFFFAEPTRQSVNLVSLQVPGVHKRLALQLAAAFQTPARLAAFFQGPQDNEPLSPEDAAASLESLFDDFSKVVSASRASTSAGEAAVLGVEERRRLVLTAQTPQRKKTASVSKPRSELRSLQTLSKVR